MNGELYKHVTKTNRKVKYSLNIYTYICHFFLIHLPVDGHLGCFHVLAIANSAMNFEVHVSF